MRHPSKKRWDEEHKDDPRRRQSKRDWDQRNAARRQSECPGCGVRRLWKGKVCMECRRGAHVRKMLELEALWNAGWSGRMICERMGWSQAPRYVAMARSEGYDLPVRPRGRRS